MQVEATESAFERQLSFGIGDRSARNCPVCTILVQWHRRGLPEARRFIFLSVNSHAHSHVHETEHCSQRARISVRSRVRALTVPSQLAKLLLFKMIRSHVLAREIARLTDTNARNRTHLHASEELCAFFA